MTTTTTLFAQFTSAVTTDSPVGTNVLARYTSNDVLDIGKDSYKVSVWDNPMYGSTYSGRPGFNYNVFYSGINYSGTLNFPVTSYPDIFHPDVCLLDNGSGKVFAVVAYNVYGTVNLMMWDVYYWDPNGTPAFVLFSSNNYNVPGTGYFGNLVNIDGNSNGDFAIVSNVGIFTGSCNGGSPTLNNGGVPVMRSFGINCDVSLFFGLSGALTPYNIVYVAYTDNTGQVKVDNSNFSSLVTFGYFASSSIPSSTMTHTSPANFWPYNPRIACPNSSGLVTDFTVVFGEEETVSSVVADWYIRGYTSSSGTINSMQTYDDGINSPYLNISPFPNLFPVVTYEGFTANDLFIGWIFHDYNGHYSGIDANYPIALKCYNNGTVPSGANYWNVPSTINTSDEITYLSFSGRYSSNNNPNDKLFATFAHNTNADIDFKEITSSSATSFRIAEKNITNSIIDKNLTSFLLKNKSVTDFQITIYDLMGKIVLDESSNANELNNLIKQKSELLTPSVYLLKLLSDDGKLAYSNKLFLGK